MTHAPRILLALSLSLAACTEGATGVPVPPDDAGRPTLPRKDASATGGVAKCDQAADGTPCGDTEGMHCVFGVCAANQCGDGVIAGDELCDDGNDRDGDGCPADCMGVTVCRDGKVDPGEECDDGNRDNGDACSNSCLANECGNGRLDFGEECDDGNTKNGDACDATCGVVACGNLRLELGEACDGTAGCPAGQTCNDTCSQCEGDPCADCEKANCSNYLDVNLYDGCHVAPDPVVTPVPMEGFIEKCVALNACVRTKAYCADPNYTARCYCGELAQDECFNATTVDGPCAALYPAATGCEAAERVSSCVIDFFTDLLVRPSGWVFYLGQCRNEYCRSECGYDADADAGTSDGGTSDAGT